VAGPEDVAGYLSEARALAKLDHSHIVPVYDVGRTSDGLCYVVSRYIEGTNLAERLRQVHPSFRESAELVAIVAEALHHAHTRDLVHRDIKPSNILIDVQGKPWVADFGLALKDEDYGKGARFAGTPAYMSPEQARGEGHRVDGRSDIFSLGIVFYELLTGRRPFRGETHQEIAAQIITAEPRPPRQIDDTIPRELERICQKALAKRASERYSTARDLAEDLRHFLQGDAAAASLRAGPGTVSPSLLSTQESTPPPSDAIIPRPPRPWPLPSTQEGLVPSSIPERPGSVRPVLKIIPKGLRSFDRHDADFFLELLPGPRDREGLPESLRFWKTRIESIDPDATFKVGLIYGPSGCGKSSLVKAGLLPRLGKNVLPVYIEATAHETEARLLRALRTVCPDLPAERTLVDAVASLRRGRVLRAGQKVLLVLDQFEQWLFARRGEENTELVAALRQCDGEHVQAIVTVRDDFWMVATRFMKDLEIDLIPDRNIAVIDLFDSRHARKVLTAFGRAYGTLPETEKTSDLTKDQESFLDQAIAGLTQDGKVVSVRLALFAETVKGRFWTPATLRELGGTEGVGVAFLQETFGSPQANPKYRLHQKAAQAVLKALLPHSGTDIKGQMRSESELQDVSGYSGRPGDFEDLIRILDLELRLITPTESEPTAGEDQPARPGSQRYYQLTHDYLVHSLRDWLTRKQRETRRGRAELRLAERAALWNARPENRYLPSVWEWASIRLLTKPMDWTEPHRRMMKRAGRVYGLRGLGLAVLAALVTWGGIEGYGRLRAAHLVDSLKTAGTADVPPIIRQLQGYRRWADPRLRRMLHETDEPSRDHLHASLALLEVDPSQVDFLGERLLSAAPGELPVLREALKPHRSQLVPRLWTALDQSRPEDGARVLPVASALALYDPEDPRWAVLGGKVAQAVVTVNPIFLGPWLDALRPVRGQLTAPLAAIFRDRTRPETEHALATNILADYAGNEPRLLADLLMDADPKAFVNLFPVAQRQAAKILPVFQAEVTNDGAAENGAASEHVKDNRAARRARAAIALVRLGQTEAVWPLLRYSEDPRLRSFLINWLCPLGIDPRAMASELARIDSSLVRHGSPGTRRVAAGTGTVGSPSSGPQEDLRFSPGQNRESVPQQQLMDAVLFHPETSMRRALILALGTYGSVGLSPGEREPLIGKLLDRYENDPDAGIHGAAEWALRQWGHQAKLKATDARLRGKDRGDRRWYLNSQGQTFVLIEGPVTFPMGSPTDESGRGSDETLHRRTIPRRFVIAAKEVSNEQFQHFLQVLPQFGLGSSSLEKYSPQPDGPVIAVSWFGAAAYCNWLSRQEGFPQDQWCYLPNERGEYAQGMQIKTDALKRKGYRLPTEAEWEYACRAGAATSRCYGSSIELLGNYAWYLANSEDRTWPSGRRLPNDLGLFDMLGNVYEQCQDHYESDKPPQSLIDDFNLIKSIDVNMPRALRGGAFDLRPARLRSANRNWLVTSISGLDIGIRIVRTYD
jgi:serine/threonine protein kinase/formylglycine-generating enzyme required for sulfatase activity